MFFNRPKKHERYYLFAGMGGSAFRRKQRRFFWSAVAVALVGATILGGLFYFLNHPHGR